MAGMRFALSLRRLPPRVALFMFRARRHAVRSGDEFTIASAIRPAELAALLRVARGRQAVTELGTGTAISAVALVLADPRRTVVTCDPCVRPEREAYLALAGPPRERVSSSAPSGTARDRAPATAPSCCSSTPSTTASPCSSRSGPGATASTAGAVVAFHDYDHPSYPGVQRSRPRAGAPRPECGRDVRRFDRAADCRRCPPLDCRACER